jgi:superfamily II DNA or RNA helicase
VTHLREYQTQALAAFREALSPEVNRVALEMATGLGKGHPLETEVPTPDGWRRWGDLEPGDAVFGRDGSSTTVLEVYDRDVLETYRVTLSDGSSVLVDGDHLWTVRDSIDSRRPWVNLETRALAALELKRSRGWRFHIPMTAPLERKPRDLPLDPYVVGALISNGSMTSSGTQLTTPDLEVAARIARAVACNKVRDVTPGTCDRYSLPGLTAVTRELGLRVGSLEKRVPAAYLEGSLEQRLDLLHGLMDGDGGGRDASRRSVGYFTSSEGLARDVSELVTSLGGTGTVRRYDRGARGVEYVVSILLPSSVPAFSTARKDGAGSSSVRNLQPKRAVVSVVLEGSSPIRCIRVAARDSLYLITRQHIVTHNTVTGAQAAVDFLDSKRDMFGNEHWAPHATGRVLVLVHTEEITGQWAEKLEFAISRGEHPYTIGVVKGPRNEVDADIVVASIWTLAQPGRREQITDVGFVIVDECHHAVAPTYLDTLDWYGAMSERYHSWLRPGIPALGLSATLSRTDGQGLGKVWQDMPFSRSLPWAIRKGYLIDLVPYTIKIPELDTSSDSALDTSLAESIAPSAVVDAWVQYAEVDGGNPSTVLFAPLVKSAQAFADAFNAAGVKAEIVHGKMSDAAVAAVMERYESGVTTVVCNAMKLTEGWDSPRTMCVIVARPTQSVPLFVQMVGRGVRPWLAPEAPAREEQRCVLLCVQGGVQQLATVADLSENIGQVTDGMSILEMEDQWDIGRDIQDTPEAYSGPVRVEAWDAAVQASSKAWQYTAGGVPFLPTAKKGQGYVFCVQDMSGTWGVWWRGPDTAGPYAPTMVVRRKATAPDLELAMAVAEDVAVDLGGDVGALLADKSRAWRKAVPSAELQGLAQSLGLGKELIKIMEGRAGGKAGRLSDLISKAQASKVLDRVADKIKARSVTPPA